MHVKNHFSRQITGFSPTESDKRKTEMCQKDWLKVETVTQVEKEGLDVYEHKKIEAGV